MLVKRLKSAVQGMLQRCGYRLVRVKDFPCDGDHWQAMSEVVPGQFSVRWGRYLAKRTAGELADKLSLLKEGLEPLSREIVDYHWEEVQLFQRTGFLDSLRIHRDFVRQALPEEARQVLIKAMDEQWLEEDRAAVRAKFGLDGAKSLFPEVFLFNLGLTFLADAADNVRSRTQGRDVIDGGAFWGDSALVLLDSLPVRKVFAFEPYPPFFRMLQRVVKDKRLENRVVPVCLGLDQTAKTTYLFDRAVGTFAVDDLATLQQFASGVDAKDGVMVDTTSIDAFVAANRVEVGLIKLDIEGKELPAVLGAERTIRDQKPILLISIYHGPEDFFEIKPLLVSWDVGYRFRIRKLSLRRQVEVMLLAY